MKISIRKTVEIKDLEQWFHVAPPEGGSNQWKVGRSALEMARFALSEEFPCVIDNVIAECGLKESVFNCEPEALTSFEKDMGKGGPRHHDLLMVGNDTLIGIEAKVSEPFDKIIKDKRKEATENMNQRLNSCLDYLYENRPDNSEELYYQLLSATIGSIIEAQRRNMKNVISLFIVFTGNINAEKDYEKHIKENDDAFKEFCGTFKLDETGGKIPSISRAPGINCWIKKIKINIGDYSYK